MVWQLALLFFFAPQPLPSNPTFTIDLSGGVDGRGLLMAECAKPVSGRYSFRAGRVQAENKTSGIKPKRTGIGWEDPMCLVSGKTKSFTRNPWRSPNRG